MLEAVQWIKTNQKYDDTIICSDGVVVVVVSPTRTGTNALKLNMVTINVYYIINNVRKQIIKFASLKIINRR